MAPSAPSKTYNNVTLSKWRKIKESAAAHGIAISDEQGKAESWGVLLGWKWSGVAQKLEIEILHSSFIMTPEDALQFVDGMISRA